jgi:hypothetical protein
MILQEMVQTHVNVMMVFTKMIIFVKNVTFPAKPVKILTRPV